MTAPPSTRRLLQESRPLALCLVLWALLAWISPRQELAFRVGGIVMAGAYAVVRGVALSTRTDLSAAFETDESFLRSNVRVVAVIVAWTLVGGLVALVHDLALGLLGVVGIRGLFDYLLPELAWAFGATGVCTALLYAVAVVASALGDAGATSESIPGGD